MLFNADKCRVMHFGAGNKGVTYSVNNHDLEVVDEEKDLGILIQSNLKVSAQCSKVIKRANIILGMIKRCFTCRSKNVVLKLYKSLVRPHLEYCVQSWRPHLAKDIDALEKVQRRATKLIEGFHDLTYEQRLFRLNLTTLETRRLRGDLIQTFKLIKGFDNVDYQVFFTMSNNTLRGNSCKLVKKRFYTNIGKYSFSNRVVDVWNSLPEEVVSSKTVSCFKLKIDDLLKNDWGLV